VTPPHPDAAFQTRLGLGAPHPATIYDRITRRDQSAA
jgi:hypothetical protein